MDESDAGNVSEDASRNACWMDDWPLTASQQKALEGEIADSLTKLE